MEYSGPASLMAAISRKEDKDLRLTDLDIRDIAEMAILERYGPPCVLVNDKFEILYLR